MPLNISWETYKNTGSLFPKQTQVQQPAFDPNAGRQEAYNSRWANYLTNLASDNNKINVGKAKAYFDQRFNQDWENDQANRNIDFTYNQHQAQAQNMISNYRKQLNQISTNANADIAAMQKPEKPTLVPKSDDYWNQQAIKYGFKNTDAVQKWQSENGLVADGKFGKESLKVYKAGYVNNSPLKPNNYQYNWNTGDFSNKSITSSNNFSTDTKPAPWLQKGGTMQQQSQDEEMKKAFIQFLVQDAAAQGVQIQSEQDLQKYAQQLGEKGIQAKYQEFIQRMQGGVKAKLGSKLTYLKKLRKQ